MSNVELCHAPGCDARATLDNLCGFHMLQRRKKAAQAIAPVVMPEEPSVQEHAQSLGLVLDENRRQFATVAVRTARKWRSPIA